MKPMRWIFVTTAGLLVLLLSCQRQSDEGVRLEQLRQVVGEFHQAINSGAVDRAVDMFAEDVIFMSNGWESVRGREAVAEIWANSITSGYRTRNQDIIELVIGGDIAYEATIQQWTMHREGQEDEWLSSKYVHIWKRQPDGSWKLHLDIWNNNPRPQ